MCCEVGISVLPDTYLILRTTKQARVQFEQVGHVSLEVTSAPFVKGMGYHAGPRGY